MTTNTATRTASVSSPFLVTCSTCKKQVPVAHASLYHIAEPIDSDMNNLRLTGATAYDCHPCEEAYFASLDVA